MTSMTSMMEWVRLDKVKRRILFGRNGTERDWNTCFLAM